jgi:predicted lactoylglutathione lyase
MAASAAFYEGLGWAQVESPDGVIAFDLIGQTLGLYPRAKLAEDLGVAEETLGASTGLTLGYNVREKTEVGALLAKVEALGGNVMKAAQDVFWGGHHGYFSDPDGHVWEVAHNPFSPLGAKGEFQWNGAGDA